MGGERLEAVRRRPQGSGTAPSRSHAPSIRRRAGGWAGGWTAGDAAPRSWSPGRGGVEVAGVRAVWRRRDWGVEAAGVLLGEAGAREGIS